MNALRPNGSVLLGLGGEHPGVAWFDCERCEIHSLFETASTESVYALASSPGGRFVIAATKGGNVYGYDRDLGSSQPKVLSGPSFSSFLSVCFASQMDFFTSDVAGQLLAWRADLTTEPKLIRQFSSPLCCLVATEGELVGLAIDGTIWFKSISRKTFQRVGRSVPPPPPFGAVDGFFHSPWNRIVFPGQGGKALFVNPTTGEVEEIQGHDSDALTLFPFDQGILSAGRSDGLLKLWRNGSRQPERVWETGVRVLSGWQLPVVENRILVTDLDGRAGVSDLGETSLHLVQELPGADFRIISAPTSEECCEIRDRRKTEEAIRIKTEMERQFQQGGQVRDLYQLEQLETMGFPEDAWDLKARLAHQEKDFIRELEIRTRLSSQLPDDSCAVAPLFAHAELLVLLGLFAEARDLLTRILKLTEEPAVRSTLNRVNSILESADGVESILVPGPDIDIPLMIRASEALGQSYRHRTQTQGHRPISCRGERVDCERLHQRILSIIEKRNGDPSHRPTLAQVRLLNIERSGPEGKAWVFANPEKSGLGHELVLMFGETSVDTIIAPSDVLNPSLLPDHLTPSEFNRACFCAYEEQRYSAASATWRNQIFKIFKTALGEEINALQSERLRGERIAVGRGREAPAKEVTVS